MTIELVLTIIGMLGGLATVWLKMNIKIASLMVEVENIKSENKSINNRLDKNDNISREDHRILSNKLDEIYRLITIIATEHEAQKNCNLKTDNLLKRKFN